MYTCLHLNNYHICVPCAGKKDEEGPSAEETRKSFKLKDHNDDGKITLEEHDNHSLEWINLLTADTMAKADTNGDGHIDKDEFLAEEL
jgi:Ca2+-binding EF-hand superfamily protein